MKTLMPLLRAASLAALAIFTSNCSGGCNATPVSDTRFGGAGQHCNSTDFLQQRACDTDDLVCDSYGGSNYCDPCGASGEPACLFEQCDPGLYAVRATGAERSVCTGCGNPGQMCCSELWNPCPGAYGSACQLGNTCSSAPTECVGADVETFYTVDHNGCLGPNVAGAGTTMAGALMCATDIAARDSLSVEPSGTTPVGFTVCCQFDFRGPTQRTGTAGSSATMASCEQSVCEGAPFTVGACPGEGDGSSAGGAAGTGGTSGASGTTGGGSAGTASTAGSSGAGGAAGTTGAAGVGGTAGSGGSSGASGAAGGDD